MHFPIDFCEKVCYNGKMGLRTALSKIHNPKNTQLQPEAMNFPVARVLVLLSVSLGISLLVSNLMAMKIWNFWGIPVDAGIFLFPISYIAGDLLVDIYGKRLADLVSTCCAGLAAGVAGILWLVQMVLPDYPGADNGAFVAMQGAVGRIFLASVAGFLASQLLNNWIFARMRRKNDAKSYWRRAMTSSAVAHLIDCIVFETLAFLGRLPLPEFLLQVIFAYVAGMILELALSGVGAKLATRLRSNLHYSNGQNEKNLL